MADVEVFNGNGGLDQAINSYNDTIGPYATISLETRLETSLNGFISINNRMLNDYRQGGYLNYGIQSDGTFRVDLDNYFVEYSGAFSTAGSYVTETQIYEISTERLLISKGEAYYSGFPLFTNFVGTALYDRVSLTDSQGTFSLDGNVFGSPNGFVEGHIADWTYVLSADADGNKVVDSAFGGDISFDNRTGSVDVKSGEFRGAGFSTVAADSAGNVGDVLNSVTYSDISVPITVTSSNFNIMEGDDKVSLTGTFGSTVYTSTGDDEITGSVGNDSIYGQSGNDTLEGGKGNDLLDGGAGADVARYGLNQSAIEGAKTLSDGSTEIRTTLGTDILVSIDTLQFADGTLSINELVNDNPTPFYDTSNGPVAADIYDGPVSFLEFQLIVTDSNDVITGSDRNDFINLLGGDDAADGGAGRDVLDGGNGSNFLTGGADADTFFSDGRGGETTWTTITDFTNVDNLNIWGWQDGVSQLIAALEDQGAEGFKGATFHYDLNGDETIDTSVTFANLQLDDIASPTTQEVAGNGYVLFLRDSIGAVPTYVEVDQSVMM